jgi:molybdopterin/thiamine biosynthesis adenylyltransferase/rhodanese-related sulfurtransferase
MQTSSAQPLDRFARQRILPGFGTGGQRALSTARVLVIGAGGLGSTSIPSLAAAGIGTIGVIDDDTVEASNLHRQLIHTVTDVGSAKTSSAAATIRALNPEATIIEHGERLTSENALSIFADYDLVLDGSDNFPTRYLANDAAVLSGLPVVWGAVSQFGGQVGVAWAARGPHYRDLFPTPAPAGSTLSCAEGGVFPTTVAVVGSLMASEALKILTGIGQPLLGRVVIFDALTAGFRELAYEPDPDGVPITELIDYNAFCGVIPMTNDLNTAGGAADAPTTVTAPELAAELASTAGTDREPLLIDVREPWEAELASIPNATLIPLGTLAGALDRLDRTDEIVVYCHHGVRSATALSILRTNGFDHSRHLEGGIDAWASLVDPTMAHY